LRTSGQPLDAGSREFFESRFGRDFSGVRLHADAAAAHSAQDVGAAAYTVGRDIVFGAGRLAPDTDVGRRLMAHELTHVVQQTGGGGRPGLRAAGPMLSLARLDLDRLDSDLNAGTATQTSGEIGAAAQACGPRQSARACQTQTSPPEDSSLPVSLELYLRNTPSPAPAQGQPAPPSQGVPVPPDPLDAGVPPPAGVPEPEAEPAPPPQPVPPPRQVPPRALIVGGIHGNERGALDIMTQLRTELALSTSPLQRDFDTLVIPVMNPGGVADVTRENRRGVDLNRNFPGLTGFPAPAGGALIPARQPETEAVIDVVTKLHPARILALHAIGGANATSSGSGGVFADPVEGDARELACRMALRMRGSGSSTTNVNTRGNQLDANVCNSRYPETASVSVTTQQSSLGAWGSAAVSAGGRGTTVITQETAGKAPLTATGARSVATIMPGIRDFLLNNGAAASEADALLRGAVSDAFLTGEGTTAADRDMLAAVTRIVDARFDDMNLHYRTVWRPAQLRLNPSVRLPARLTKASHERSFDDQARIMRGELRGLTRTSTPSEIDTAILTAMQTRSMPGFSRHHWGTEIDVLSATRTDWEGTGTMVPVIPFLQTEARRFGFFHPYTSSPPNAAQRHYQTEPWHISYAPLANVFTARWQARMTGTVLDSLITRAADRVRGQVPLQDMVDALKRISVQEFQSNVSPSP
jgi:predicted deacylase